MVKRLFAVGALLFLVTGCAAMAPFEVKEERYGKSIPMIAQSFASPQMRPGETWKVYLKASDPDGDMKNIYASIFQYGMGSYPAGITKIPEGNGKELSGYVYLYTRSDPGLNFVNLILTINIQDKAGHFSQPVTFPLAFNNTFRQKDPPSGVFEEKDLGPIMTGLRTDFNGDHGHYDSK
jgi:hypothetical protein